MRNLILILFLSIGVLNCAPALYDHPYESYRYRSKKYYSRSDYRHSRHNKRIYKRIRRNERRIAYLDRKIHRYMHRYPYGSVGLRKYRRIRYKIRRYRIEIEWLRKQNRALRRQLY
jgi:hypothetical protein